MSTHSEAILILAATSRDATLAVRTIEQQGLKARVCRDVAELELALWQGIGGVLLSEEACEPETINVFESFWNSQPTWSDLPIIFLQLSSSAHLESRTTDLFLSRGNLTLLQRPLRQNSLISAIETALRARRRQYQVRDLIDEKEADVRGRDEFLAMLGHELRNPLAAIRYAIGFMNEIDENEFTRKPRDVINRQTTHLARLVDDLLDVARVTRGKISLDKKPIDLNEQARKTLESLEAAHQQDNHEITLTLSPTPLVVEGDAVRLEQILSNLLFNAVKYTPSSGHIQMILERQENYAVVGIEDDGVGMSQELIARVFDLFSQAQHSIDRSRGGLGIGLTLVRGLVELHDGQISATSDGIGKGSRFEVKLPLLHKDGKITNSEKSNLPKGKRRVLLIEDNEDSRQILTLLLEHSGHVVDSAADGQEGLNKAIETCPDIALVDIGLPIIDGYEVATRVREACGDSIFLVALTGYNQPDDRRRAQEAGFNEHLAKPVAAAQLRELLARIGD